MKCCICLLFAVIAILQDVASAQENPCKIFAQTYRDRTNLLDNGPVLELISDPADEYLTVGSEIKLYCCFVDSTNGGWLSPMFQATGDQPLFNDGNSNEGIDNSISGVFLRYVAANLSLSLANDNISVYCQAKQLHNLNEMIVSNKRLLLIAGVPDAPMPMFKILGPDLIQLQWETVNYAYMDDYPLTGYKVDITQGDNTIQTMTVNGTVVNISLPAGIDRNECTELTFKVVAMNQIGESMEGTINGGFPKPAAASNFEVVVRAEVLFTQNQMTRIDLSATKPDLCSYETIEYCFVIEENNKEVLRINGSIEVKDPNQYIEETRGGALEPNKEYSVYVEFTDIEGRVHSTQAYNFSTRQGINESNLPYYILAIVVGTCAILVVIILLIACCFYIRQKRRKRGAENMVHNEFYSGGPVYDYVGDSSFRMQAVNGNASSASRHTDIPLPVSLKVPDDYEYPELPPRGPKEPRYTSPSRSLPEAGDTYVTMNSSGAPLMNGLDT